MLTFKSLVAKRTDMTIRLCVKRENLSVLFDALFVLGCEAEDKGNTEDFEAIKALSKNLSTQADPQVEALREAELG